MINKHQGSSSSLSQYIDSIDYTDKEKLLEELVEDVELCEAFEKFSREVLGILSTSKFHTIITTDSTTFKQTIWRSFLEGYLSNSLRIRKTLENNNNGSI